MLASREPKKRTASWDELTGRWLAALRDTITDRDPVAREVVRRLARRRKDVRSRESSALTAYGVASAVEAATVHLGRRLGAPSVKHEQDKAAPSARCPTCDSGRPCKAYAAATAIFALNDAICGGAENLHRFAKAIAKMREDLSDLAKRNVRAFKAYLPWMNARHAQHEKLLKRGWPIAEHDVLCRRPTLVLETLRHLQRQIDGVDRAMLVYLPATYRHPFGQKGHLSLLDLVTEPLLPAFRDREIADLIPDGLGENAIQRVSNRRLKRTGSRAQPEKSEEPTGVVSRGATRTE